MAIAGGLFFGAPAISLASTPKAQCLATNLAAQTLRRDGKLAAAREALRACADPTCPEKVRDDCALRIDELEHAQPTIVFDAKDPAGGDLSLVTVTVDGKPLADKLNGAAFSIDPGTHVFTFTTSGEPTVTRTFVLAEAVKGRHETVVLGKAPPVVPVGPPASTGSGGLGTTRWVGLAVGSAGVAGIVIGSVFGALTFSEASQQKSDCASTPCKEYGEAASAHSSATADGIVSTTAFIAGGTFLAGGVVLFLLGRPSSGSSATMGGVMPSVGPSGATLTWRGAF